MRAEHWLRSPQQPKRALPQGVLFPAPQEHDPTPGSLQMIIRPRTGSKPYYKSHFHVFDMIVNTHCGFI